MKYIYAISFLFIFSFSVYSQTTRNESTSENPETPEWANMMQDNDIPLEQVQQAFNEFWSGKPRSKGDGWKPFKRWEWYMSQRVNPDGSRPEPDAVVKEYKSFMNTYSQGFKSTSGSWNELGPVSMPANGTGQPNGLGRVNAVAFHPTNSNILYIAAPSGGVWKTTDGGTSWIPLTDTLPTLGASSLLIDPTNTNTVYFGSGDRDGADAPGLGVFKSTDAGNTWSSVNTGMGNETVGDMLMHPTNSSIIIAATSDGIYRTTNGGSSWTKTTSSSAHFKDLEFKPGNPNIVYAAADGTFYRSTNNGQSWSSVSSGLPGSGRYVIGVSAANSSYVYVVSGDYNGLVGCYRSTNSGTSFSTRSTSPNILGYSETGNDNRSQAWYDLAIAVDPSNANTVYVGGINIWKSSNGGSSWSLNAHWVGSGGVPAVHADIHSLDFSPVNSRLYSGNDGGVYYTSNGGSTWIEISDGLAIAQVYKLGQSASQQNLIINGYQDNGTAIYNGSWTTEIGGDGMECIIDPGNTNYVYGALYYGDIRRSTNGGTSFDQIAADGVNGINETGAWVTPYILHVNNSNTMIAGYKNLWRSTNVKTSNAGSVSWTKLTNSLAGTNNENIHIIEQSEADPDILYFYREDNKLFRSDNFNNSSPGFSNISSSLPYSSYSYSLGSDLEAHPTNSNIVYLTLYQGVYKSTNKGANWTDISANLPSISVNCIVMDTASTNEALYVGTDAGVYYKDNTMSNWIPFMDGMPAAAEITELEIYYNSSNHQLSKLVASTYGRGLWRSNLYSSGALLPVVDFGYDQSVICTGDTVQFSDSTIFNPTSWSWTFSPSTVTYVGGTSASSQNPKVKFTTPGYYTVSLTATNNNGSATETKAALIKAGGIQPPFLETFETNSSTIGEWGVSNPDNDKTWQLAGGLGGTTPGTRAATLNHYAYSTIGERDGLFSPALNLSNVSSASLIFKHAYTRYPSYASDSLIIYASSDCGSSWTRLTAKAEDGTGSHATAPDNTYSSSNNFEPSGSTDWCGAGVGPNCYTINLNSFAGNDDVILRFEAYNNYSNNLYLDNIQVSGSSSSPVTASFTTTTTSICTGNSVGFASTSQNATSFAWKINGVVISNSQSFTRTFFTAGTYQVWLIASNSNDVDSTSQTITVNPLPGTAATPTGNTALCANPASTVYSTSGAANATSYVWSLSPSSAGTITGSGASITIDWDNTYSGTADISVKGVNSCGDGSYSASLTVTISDLPGPAGQPNGATSLCKDAPNTVYVTGGASYASSYQWSLSPASAGTINGNGTMATVDWDNSFTGTANVIVQGSNNCGTGASATLSVNITELPVTPASPSGVTTLCEDPGTISYSVQAITGATSYDWQLQPGSAGTISATGNSVDVSWSSTFTGAANLSVAAVNSCGTGSYSNPLSISVNANPPVPTITQSNDTLYSSSPTGNQWYLPSGSIVGAVYQYFIPSTNSVYYVVVTDSNGCSAQSAPYSYTGSSVENMLNNKELKLYPNPVSELLTIEYSGSEVLLLKMTNKLGQEVKRTEFSNKQGINVSKLSSGIYFVEVRIKNNPSEKIIWKIFVE